MLKNNLMNMEEIREAWEDVVGDVGMFLEVVEMTLKLDETTDGKELTADERCELKKLQQALEEIQECYWYYEKPSNPAKKKEGEQDAV